MAASNILAMTFKKIDFRFVLNAAVAAFITYLSMYAFRKPFTAATYDGLSLWGVDYKILLIITQLIGYTISKYIGIKYVSELHAGNRTRMLIMLMGFAWVSLFFLPSPPFHITFLSCFSMGCHWA